MDGQLLKGLDPVISLSTRVLEDLFEAAGFANRDQTIWKRGILETLEREYVAADE